MCRCDEDVHVIDIADFAHCSQLNLSGWLLSGQHCVSVTRTQLAAKEMFMWIWSLPLVLNAPG